MVIFVIRGGDLHAFSGHGVFGYRSPGPSGRGFLIMPRTESSSGQTRIFLLGLIFSHLVIAFLFPPGVHFLQTGLVAKTFRA